MMSQKQKTVGRIEAICRSESKGVKKTLTSRGQLLAGFGLEGDAHGGEWHRQVSLLDVADVEIMRRRLPDLEFGAFAENLVLAGVDLAALGLGSRLRLGREAEVVFTQRGKTCHSRCAIYYQTGDCIMPRLGVFARVLASGNIQIGDEVEVLEAIGMDVLQAVVIIASDSSSRGEANDTAGPRIAELVRYHLNAHVYATEVVPDEDDSMAERLCHYANGPRVDLVLVVGGTGLAPRNVTPEAVHEIADGRVPILDETMRAASLQSTNNAVLSLAPCAIRNRTLILSVPGSWKAEEDNLHAVLPALSLGIAKLRGGTTPSASVLSRNEDLVAEN